MVNAVRGPGFSFLRDRKEILMKIGFLISGICLILITSPVWAIMAGGPVEVMKEDMAHKQGQLSLETNFIFESDISPDTSDNAQVEEGEWYLVKGTVTINDALDFYVRIGASHLQQTDSTQSIKEELKWGFGFGGGIMAEIYEYKPWGLQVILDTQYYATFPDIDSVRIGSTTYSSVHAASYKEHNIQTSMFSRVKTGPISPYIGITFLYKDISNKFTVNNTDYNLSGKNKNKIGLTVGFDFPFELEELVSGTGILSVEGRFFNELGLSVALTNRF